MPAPKIMAALNLNSISENASRLGMRIQESFSEHTRDIIIRGSSSAIFDTPDDRGKDIRKQLDSSSDREKLDAMKRLIAVRTPLSTPHMWCSEQFNS